MKKKNRLLRFAFVLAFLVSLGLGNELWAQTTYYSIGSGSWSNSGGTIWSTVGTNGAAAAAGVYPVAGDIVYIEDGDDVTLDLDSIAVATLTVRNSTVADASSLVLNGKALRVTGNLAVTAGGTTGYDATITGTANVSRLYVTGDITITGSTATEGIATINMNAAATYTRLSCSALTMAVGAGTDRAVLDLTDCYATIGGTLTVPSASVTLTTSATTTVSLLESNTIPTDMAAVNLLTLASGKSYTIAHNFAADSLVASGASLTLSAAALDMSTVTTWVTTSATNLTLNNATSATGWPTEIVDLNNLTLSHANSDITLGANLTLAGNLVFAGAATLATGSYNLTVTGTTDATTAAGIVTSSGGNLTFTGNVDKSGAWDFTDSYASFGGNLVNTAGAITGGLATTIAGDLTVTTGAFATGTGDLTVTGNTLIANAGGAQITSTGGTITFTGTYNNAGAGILDVTGTTVNFYSTITSFGTNQANFVRTATSTINLLGSGTVGTFTFAADVNMGNLNITRAATVTLATAGAFDATFNSLNIAAGATLTLPDPTAGANPHVVTNAAVINGTLDIDAITTATNGITFSGALSGTGIIDAVGAADGAGEPEITIAGAYSFGGTLTTDQYTNLIINSTQAADVVLPSSVTALNLLGINRGSGSRNVVLGASLTLTGTYATELISGILKVNGYTLTLPGAATTNAAGWSGIDIKNNSTLALTGAAVLANLKPLTDETSNFTITGAVTSLPATVEKVNNLTYTNAATLALTGALDVYGTLSVNTGSFDVVDYDLTLRGLLSGNGTAILTPAAATSNVAVKFYGAAPTVTTQTIDGTTKIQILGNSAEFIVPAAQWGIIGKITLNRINGMKLSAAITALGNTSDEYDLDIVSGDLDLNGFAITLANATDKIREAAGYTVINESTTKDVGIYTVAGGSSKEQIVASGIGVTEITGVPTVLVVKRFPQTASISGVGTSASRIYQITFGGGTAPTALKFAYDNDDLGTNRPAALKVYQSAAIAMTSALESGTEENTAGAVKGSAGTLTFATGDYYAIASPQSVAAGGINTFNNTSGDNSWTTASNWSTGAVPTAADIVIIPTGMSITLGGNVEVNDININGTSAIDLGANTMSVAGNMTVNSSATSAFKMSSGAILTVLGNLELAGSGNILFNDGDVTSGANERMYVSVNGTITKTGTGSFVSTSGTDYGTYLTLGGSVDVTLPSDFATLHTLTINKLGGTVYQSGNLNITGNATLDVTSGTYVVGDYNLTVAGATTVASGAILNANYTNSNVTRTFTGTVTITGTGILNASGPRISSGYNNTFSDVVTLGNGTAGTVLNISQSATSFAAAVSGNAAWTLNAQGAGMTVGGVITFTNGTFQTDQHTDLTLNIAPSGFPAVDKLNNLTLGANLTLAGNMELTGELDLGAISMTLTGYTLTVNGEFDASDATLVSTGGATIVVNGPVTAQANWGTTFTDVDVLNLTVGGSGTLSALPVAIADMAAVTMNRPNVTLTYSAAATTTLNSLIITNGTVLVPAGNNFVVTTTTVIGENGILDADVTGAAASRTFTTGLSGSGKLYATGATAVQLATVDFPDGCVYTFTGSIYTNQYTNLDIDADQTSDFGLPASITNLNSMIVKRGALTPTVTLNNDLTIVANVDATYFDEGTLVLNGKTITFTGTYTSAAATDFKMNAVSGSSMVFNGAPTFVASAITTDETTNLTIGATPAVAPAFTLLNNVNVTNAANYTLGANVELYGNLAVVSGATFTKGNFTLTVNGDVSNAGTMTLSTTGDITLKGQMNNTAAGTITTGALTELVIAGSSSQFVMPADIATLGTLTLNRANGMQIAADLTVGLAAGGTDLVLTSGDLDLNGYKVIFAQVNTAMSEAAGATVINTGATSTSTGYITTAVATTSATNIQNSGIGARVITTGAGLVVKRYPTIVPIAGVGLSVGRVYQIDYTTAPTALTLDFDNTEVASNVTALRLYTSSTPTFTIFDDRTLADGSNRIVNQNTPLSGRGNLAYSEFNTTGQNVALASGHYFAMAALPGTGGILYTANASGEWGNSATWSPAGTPTANDQVYIGPQTVTLRGNGQTFTCQALVLNHNSAKLIPYNDGTSGDNVTLNVMGNISVTNGASVDAVNGTGRLNIEIGDGITAGVASTITASTAYVTDNGLSVNNLTLNSASANAGSGYFRVFGNISMLGNSALTSTGEIELYGGSNATQSITIPTSASLEANDIRVTNSANVTTGSSFVVKGLIQVDPAAQFVASAGTVTFPEATQDAWAVQQGATLRLYNIELGNSAAGSITPTGNIEVAGNFTKTGANTFATTNLNTVTFKNSGQRELVHGSSTASLLQFYNLVLAPNASVKTSSSFQIGGDIDVQDNASFVADNGTIDMIIAPVASSYIKNVSDHTLNFFNLTCTDDVLTSDNWKISGILDIVGSLKADKGTITFENVSEKTITNSGGAATDLTFFGLKVATGSKVKTAAAQATGSFYVKNNVTNPTGAGIFVEGTGSLVITTPTSTTYFDAGAGIAAGNPKTISKSSAGTLKLGVMQINATTNNEVTTATDFEIAGSGAATFNNAGAGAKFTATAGTVKFTGTAPYIASVSPAVSTFYNVLTEGATNLSVTDAQEIYINGNLTVDGTSQFNPGGDQARVLFTGTVDQTIGGASTIINPVEFARLVINKTNGTTVSLNTDVEITSAVANSQLVLTNGILNLGSKKLTVGAPVISRLNGAINGATGTYVVNTNHKGTMLEDAYFTVNSIPTLYNLTVSNAHTTANDLTVNGTLNLNTGALTIAAGTSLATAKQLILNGNLTRTAGTITCATSAATSKLVFQGTGTVSGGLQDNFFTGGTVPSIVMARQETLGGNLTIDAAGNLTINSGTKYFDLSNKTLTFTAGATVSRISGSITAGLTSTVAYGTIRRVPANLFTNNQVGNFTATGSGTPDGLYLDGDLAIMTSLNYPNTKHIYTGENTLTFGPSLTFSNPMTSANHVKGNLVRTVNANTLLEFPIGTLASNGTAANYTPVSMRLQTSGNTQLIKATVAEVDPTTGRGGNSTNAVNLTYTLAPYGTTISDNVQLKFQYPNLTSIEQTVPVANGAFPAKWNGLGWTDYRNNLATFAANDPRVVTMSDYPVAISNLSGYWAIFTVSTNTNEAKDKAISMTANRVVITKLEPNPVKAGQAFKATVQLQDMNGQPITATSAFNIRIAKEYGEALTVGNMDAIIPVGSSMAEVAGLVINSASKGNQLKADTVGGSSNWQPTLTSPFAVLDAAPAIQSSNIAFSAVKETSMRLSWTNGSNDNQIVLAKAESLLEESEFPTNATTYIANTNFGSGSSIGNATVLYKGDGTTLDVTGLSPNTNYYFYVLAYSGSEGYENYKLTAATKNPNAQKTTGTSDDDVSLGTNNTLADSRPIGTNTPVTGTIGSATDEDWFNFSVTNATPNVRVQMYGLANNYNVEVYDMAGRRIRRGIRTATGSEGPVVNNLPAGTYTLRIYSADGSYSSTNTYTLKVGTKSSEIFSVTP